MSQSYSYDSTMTLPKREDMMWLAGILEGEGTFSCSSNGRIRVRCTMTDQDIIERIRTLVNAGNIHLEKKRQSHHKQAWVWSLDKTLDVYALIVGLYAFMGNRRKAKIREQINAFKQHKRSQLDTQPYNKSLDYTTGRYQGTPIKLHHTPSNQTIEGRGVSNVARQLNMPACELSRLVSGKRKSAHGWRMV